MWETTAEQLRARGVRLEFEAPVARIEQAEGRIRAVQVRNADGAEQRYEADSFVSTMPVRDLVLGLAPRRAAGARGRSRPAWSTAISSPSACSTGG